MKITLSHPDAIYFPFTFKIGDRVRSTLDSNLVGVIVDADFVGPDFKRGEIGAYEIVYSVRRSDGAAFFLPREIEIQSRSSTLGQS